MKDNTYDIYSEEFIARWMSGDESAEAQKAFEAHPDYGYYTRIKKASEQLSFSDFDQEKAFDTIQKKTQQNVIPLNAPTKSNLWKYVMTTAAAVVLLFIGIFFSSKNASYAINAGEQLAVQLPDKSEVLLNGNSRVTFSKKNWKEDRVVDLEGEGYFKVEKGEKFTVNSQLGKVQVLGTQFTVNALGDSFIVKCFEGRVGVTAGKHYREITRGMAIQVRKSQVDAWTFVADAPSWVTNATSKYRKIKVSELITALQRQYDVEILGLETVDQAAIFTGSFPNNDLKEAANVIFKTLDVNYKLESNSKIIILKE